MNVLPSDPGHITIYLLSSLVDRSVPVGVTQVPLRSCREIYTEAGQLVGWYIRQTSIAIIRSGALVGLLFMLPNNEPLLCSCQDFGIRAGLVQIGQLVTLEDLRLLHTRAKPLVVAP